MLWDREGDETGDAASKFIRHALTHTKGMNANQMSLGMHLDSIL